MSDSIHIKSADVDHVVSKVTDIIGKERGILVKKVTDITNVVFQTAHTKRAMMTAKEAKAQHRSKRVSDPNAEYGVPVDTGALQASIQKEVIDSGKVIEGHVFVDKASKAFGYAPYMEGTKSFGGRPRPFLSSAIKVNRDWISKYWKQRM